MYIKSTLTYWVYGNARTRLGYTVNPLESQGCLKKYDSIQPSTFPSTILVELTEVTHHRVGLLIAHTLYPSSAPAPLTDLGAIV